MQHNLEQRSNAWVSSFKTLGVDGEVNTGLSFVKNIV